MKTNDVTPYIASNCSPSIVFSQTIVERQFFAERQMSRGEGGGGQGRPVVLVKFVDV